MTMRPVGVSFFAALAIVFLGIAGCDDNQPATSNKPASTAPADHGHGDRQHEGTNHDHSDAEQSEKKPVAHVPADYPLKVCVVSGEDLGSMGKPVKIEHGDDTAYLCCSSCIDKFNATPDKYIAKLKPAKSE